MKTQRFIQDDEKLSLKYIVGSYIASLGPVSFNSIVGWVEEQYIGNPSEEEIKKAIQELIAFEAAEYYDSDIVYNITQNTLEYINLPHNKFEKR
jgi:hypothetical protein